MCSSVPLRICFAKEVPPTANVKFEEKIFLCQAERIFCSIICLHAVCLHPEKAKISLGPAEKLKQEGNKSERMAQVEENIRKQLAKPQTWFCKYFPKRIRNVGEKEVADRNSGI